MKPGEADVYLYLKPKKSSSFDGVLGVLPDPLTGEILFTGDIQLNLLNSFKKGETIKLEWQRLQTQTSQLDINFKYPFLFNTPLGTDFHFNLYRRDTTFSQNRVNVGLEYYFVGSNTVRIFFENQGANTIGDVENTSTELADSRTNLFGIGATYSNLDYRFNPRKGFDLNTSIAAGRKEITSALPEDTESKSDVYNINLKSSYFVPLFKRSTMHFRLQGGVFLNENMFRNEIYRLGGLQTLRGFDEQAIFASAYGIGTVELRFILEQNSNLFLFFDQAYYEDQARETPVSDNPFGFGGGINFETNAGIFSLTYALGKQFDNNISFRGGKVHFGFTSFF
jgi:hemolysin activation/secretion protein